MSKEGGMNLPGEAQTKTEGEKEKNPCLSRKKKGEK